jgi:hypothetical protein
MKHISMIALLIMVAMPPAFAQETVPVKLLGKHGLRV